MRLQLVMDAKSKMNVLTLLKNMAVWACGVADYLLIEKYLK
jgi:hypothetical protein